MQQHNFCYPSINICSSGFFREGFLLDRYRKVSNHRPIGCFPTLRKFCVCMRWYCFMSSPSDWCHCLTSEIYNMGIIYRETITERNIMGEELSPSLLAEKAMFYLFFLFLFYFTTRNPSKIAGGHSQLS